MYATETSLPREIAVLPSPAAGKPERFIVWAGDVPYFADFKAHGAGFYHRFVVRRADDSFAQTLANTPVELFADPDDVGDDPAGYISSVLERAT